MGKNCSIPGCPNEKYNGRYLKGFGFPQNEELRKRVSRYFPILGFF